jgi:hypothetical protein
MNYGRSSDENIAKIVVYGALLVVMVIFYVWFYSADASGSGIVSDKWTETHTSCSDDGGCHTTTSYLAQLRDGNIYGFFWGNRDWDRVQSDFYIEFVARGRRLSIFGWRVATPDIFELTKIVPTN